MPQTTWLKTTQLYPLTVLESRSPKLASLGRNQGVRRASLWRLWRRSSLPPPASGCCQHSLSLQTSDLPRLHLHYAFSSVYNQISRSLTWLHQPCKVILRIPRIRRGIFEVGSIFQPTTPLNSTVSSADFFMGSWCGDEWEILRKDPTRSSIYSSLGKVIQARDIHLRLEPIK